jgi:hypothetical protein
MAEPHTEANPSNSVHSSSLLHISIWHNMAIGSMGKFGQPAPRYTDRGDCLVKDVGSLG